MSVGAQELQSACWLRPKYGAHLWVLEKNSPAAAVAAEHSAPFLEPPQSPEGAQTVPSAFWRSVLS